jgi:hypothetical protein
MVNISSSSNEEGLIADTSCDEEFAGRLFDDLNHDFLGLPDDVKIIILSDSDEEEEEVREEKIIDVKVVPSSAMRSLAPTAFDDNADDADKGDTPDRVIGGSNSDRDEADLP